MIEIKSFAASMLDPSAKLCPVQKNQFWPFSLMEPVPYCLSLEHLVHSLSAEQKLDCFHPPILPSIGYIQINKLLLIVFKYQSSSISTFQIHFYHKTKGEWEGEGNKIQGFGFKQRIKFLLSKRDCAFQDMNRVARCPFLRVLRVERKGLLY